MRIRRGILILQAIRTKENDQRGDSTIDDDQEDLSDEQNEDDDDEDQKGCLTSCLNFISRLFNYRR